MAGINTDAFLKAVQSESIVLEVGKQQEPVSIARHLLSMQSEYLAKHIAKCDGRVDMQNESPIAVKMFIRWCYRGHLEPPTNTTDLSALKKHKNALLRLWIFGATHGIGKLQNHCMRALLTLFNTAHLLNTNDVRFIWTRALGTMTELRILTTLVLVVQIEEGEKKDAEYALDVEDINQFGQYEGFTSEMYSSLKMWLLYQPPKSPRKDKRTKWSFLVEQEEVRELLMVDEKPRGILESTKEQVKKVGLRGQIDFIEID